jgi:putative ABC transport system permease protein
VNPALFRWCRAAALAARAIVPADHRQDWRQEWEAELQWYEREAALARRDGTPQRGTADLLRRTAGAWRHALTLRRHAWSIDMVQDIRYACRALRLRPAYSLVALATLTLAIGATTAIFSIVYGVLLRPLPFRDSDRLVQLWETNPPRGWTEATIAPANLLDWRARNRVFEAMAFYVGSDSRGASLNDYVYTGAADADRLQAVRVSTNFFDVLGVPPMLGRGFHPSESEPGQSAVIVLSEGAWRQRFAGASDVVGRSVALDGTPHTVVGVMPASFRFGWERPDFWIPMGMTDAEMSRVRVPHWLRVVARLKPGVTIEQAREDLTRIAAELEREHPQTNAQMGAGLGPLDDWFVGNVRGSLLVFLGAVGFVLLIACANVAGLMVARATERARELSIRTALGASRLRLMRQLLAESALLAGAGATLGTLAAWWVLGGLVTAIPPEVPRLDEVRIDLTVLAFVAAVACGTVLLFGITPALQAARTAAAPALKAGARNTSAGGRHLRRLIVVAEVALAVALLAGAGVLLRSFDRLQSVETGIDPQGVITAEVTLPDADYDTPERAVAFWEAFAEQLRAIPGVIAAGGSSRIALQGYDWTGDLSIEGRPEVWGRGLRHKQIVPGYFQAMKLPLREGRSFLPTDDRDAPRVVIVNAALAREFFGSESPVGRRISFSRPDAARHTWRTVIGVVADEKQDGLNAAVQPEVYVSHRQSPQSRMTMVVRGSLPPDSLVADMRSALRTVDPGVPLFDVQTMEQIVAATTRRERFTTLILSGFAAMAIALAAVGIYGLVAYSVGRRTLEIGVRMALGAPRAAILRMVLREGLAQVSIGIVIGIGLALLTGRAIESLLFETGPSDPVTLGVVAALLVVVSLVASVLPARRAARVDPLTAMRSE